MLGLASLQARCVRAGPRTRQKAGKRLALVIGNSSYQNIMRLTNPVNDAADVAEKLKSLKFEVLLATDASQAKMTSLCGSSTAKLTREHVALVFYAGHGMTVNKRELPASGRRAWRNRGRREWRAASRAVNGQLLSMASVLSPLEASRIGIVFLDACRTNAAVPGAWD